MVEEALCSTASTEEVAGDGCVRGKEILRLIYCLRLALYTGAVLAIATDEGTQPLS